MNALEEYCRINNISTSSSETSSLLAQDGFSNLLNVKGLLIKQSFQPLESLTGFQQENSYSILATDENGNELSKIFECQEKSNLCWRLILGPETRPFEARIKDFPSGSDFIVLKRKFKCTFFCYNRPRLEVISFVGGEKTFLGSIMFPFKCSCDYRLEIFGSNRKKKFIIFGNCCQLGILCKGLPCDKCQKARFSIINAETNVEIACLKKKSPGFWKSALSTADNFSIIFPSSMGVEEKALIMSAMIFLDYNFFESPKSKPNLFEINK